MPKFHARPLKWVPRPAKSLAPPSVLHAQGLLARLNDWLSVSPGKYYQGQQAQARPRGVLACLPARVPACLPACLPANLPACLPAPTGPQGAGPFGPAPWHGNMLARRTQSGCPDARERHRCLRTPLLRAWRAQLSGAHSPAASVACAPACPCVLACLRMTPDKGSASGGWCPPACWPARACSPHILEAPRTSSASKLSAKRAPVPPQPFNFITDDRLQRRHQQQQQQQQQQETFKALPLNRALLDHPVRVCPVRVLADPDPQGPALWLWAGRAWGWPCYGTACWMDTAAAGRAPGLRAGRGHGQPRARRCGCALGGGTRCNHDTGAHHALASSSAQRRPARAAQAASVRVRVCVRLRSRLPHPRLHSPPTLQ